MCRRRSFAGGALDGVRYAAMILPLELLIADDSNRYELCSAAMRRANQLSLAADEDVEANGGKVVSTAVKQILTKKVRYEIERTSL
jgi:DNA-directed RNA polymerase subunit omega